MAEQAGTRLGHYRLVEPIGSGGFATVYRAVDERLDSDVAIKVLAENHALDIEIRERFLAEARVLRRVACEAVVPVYDVGETERAQPFIVLAYADRGDLRDRVTQRSAAGHRLGVEDVLVVAETLAIALGRAHRVGLVHRDVKPTNLLIASTKGEARGRPLGRSPMLAHDERLLLGDLGLAKDLAASSGLTVGAGTHGFSAPEQRSGLSRVDVRADVYGASAVLYWMTTKALPSDDAAERASKLAATDLPADVSDAIGRGLAADPADRFTDIDLWLQAMTTEASPSATGLAEAGNGVSGPRSLAGLDGRRSGTAASDTAAVHQRSGGHGVALAALLVGAVVAAGVTFVAVRDGGPSVTELDGDRARIVEQRNDLTVAIEGPTSVAAGSPAEFEASANGAISFRWFTPDGTVQDGNPLVLTSSGPGEATVTLVASDDRGRTTTVEFDFTVTVSE